MARLPPFDIVRVDALDGVAHGFFGHGGGAFQFGYGGPGASDAIATLRAQAARAIAPGSVIVAPHQVHSSDVLSVEEPWPDEAEGRPRGDALVTARSGLALAIVTADCAPVLLADTGAGVIGAAHAGWRGALGDGRRGVLENTVEAMERLGAVRARICAAIGPAIAQPSYEVDEAFRARFAPADARFFAPGRSGHWQFDLPAYIAARLRDAGVEKVAECGLDTYRLEQRFYSYRRATHRGEPGYGRQLSLVALA